jgi:acyl carrier protein
MAPVPEDLGALRAHILKRFAKRGTASLDDKASLVKSGMVDSFGIVEIVSFLEAEYGVRLPDADVVPENFETLETIRALLRRCAG